MSEIDELNEVDFIYARNGDGTNTKRPLNEVEWFASIPSWDRKDSSCP